MAWPIESRRRSCVVDASWRSSSVRALALEFFHALLNARVLIDQSLAGVTHKVL